MRNNFAEYLLDEATKNKHIFLLSGDIGNHLFDKFKEKFSDRFINCGVAEQNMFGVAAGLASKGLRPVIYTIASFAVYRVIEQIKLDLCYQNKPVVIVGTGAGLQYSHLGVTHYSLEDIGMLRTIPNLRLYSPADSKELRYCLRDALESHKPAYIRIGKKEEANLQNFDESNLIEFGFQANLSGKNLLLISSGVVCQFALELRNRLKELNIESSILSICKLKPISSDKLVNIFNQFQYIVTIEEHSKIGGLGSIISEIIIDNDLGRKIKLKIYGTEDKFPDFIGDVKYARETNGLNLDSILSRIIAWI